MTAEIAAYPFHGHDLTALALVFLVLRAFASGCTALTGVEAISNGVPFFKPRSRNAAVTLVAMGALAVTMFYGVTLLATAAGVKYAENPTELGLPADYVQQTVIAQLGSAVFGAGSFGFYFLQIATMLILVLAANTAYNAFPQMASVLGRDGFLPRQLGRRGDRLAFSNGIILLATAAALLIAAFDASVTRLVQLYILGVFLAFTLSQFGMVRHWSRELRKPGGGRRGLHTSRAINLVGAVVTSLVLVIVVLTKFSHGAWLVMVAIPLFVTLMIGIKRHYRTADARLAAPDAGFRLPSRVHAVVLVSKVNAPALQALAYARATRPSTLVALHVELDAAEQPHHLERQWIARDIPVPLVIVDSPYRDLTGPVVEHVQEHPSGERARHRHRDYVPEYVVPLVGTAPAQPIRAAPEDPAAVPPRGDRHQRAPGAAGTRTTAARESRLNMASAARWRQAPRPGAAGGPGHTRHNRGRDCDPSNRFGRGPAVRARGGRRRLAASRTQGRRADRGGHGGRGQLVPRAAVRHLRDLRAGERRDAAGVPPARRRRLHRRRRRGQFRSRSGCCRGAAGRAQRGAATGPAVCR